VLAMRKEKEPTINGIKFKGTQLGFADDTLVSSSKASQ
jgi:hypothetical protein